MISKFIEITDEANWGKFHLSQWDAEDLKAQSQVREGVPLLTAVEDMRQRAKNPLLGVFVRDLQTEEGITLYPEKGIDPTPQLDAHGVWVCPLFLPFCHWLFQNYAGSVAALPAVVNLPVGKVLHLQGYRRPGQEMLPLAAIRGKMLAALTAVDKLPANDVEMTLLLKGAVEEHEWHFFCVWRDGSGPQEYKRFLGSMMTQSGRYQALPIPGRVMYVPMNSLRGSE